MVRYRGDGGGPGGRVAVEVGAAVVKVLGQVGERLAADLTLV